MSSRNKSRNSPNSSVHKYFKFIIFIDISYNVHCQVKEIFILKVVRGRVCSGTVNFEDEGDYEI